MKRAYTLVEMLIVVTIMIMLVAVTIPVAKKVMDGNRVREASRQLSAYFAMAKARATQTGRPCGVEFVCVRPIGGTASDRIATQFYMAEVPAGYSGGTTAAKAMIRMEGGLQRLVPLVPVYYIDANFDGRLDDDANSDGVPDPADADSDGRVDMDAGEHALLLSLIPAGEKFSVRFDHKGPWYDCQRNSNNQFIFSGTNNLRVTMVPPSFSNHKAPGFPYTIHRLPRSAGNPLEIPVGTAVDMAYCGIGVSGREFSTVANRIAAMVTPNGGIDTIYVDGVPLQPTASLHFLIGRIEKAGAHTAAAQWSDREVSTLADPESLWVSVSTKSGIAITSENTPDATQAATIVAYVKSGRLAATSSGEQMSGR